MIAICRTCKWREEGPSDTVQQRVDEHWEQTRIAPGLSAHEIWIRV